MNRNVEIKARARDWEAQLKAAKALSGSSTMLSQKDVYFQSPLGRLKLRRQGNGEASLIYYERPDSGGPKTSFYEIAPIGDGDAIHRILGLALGESVTISKKRQLFLIGQTRVHFDMVEGLGLFIELEVVLKTSQDEAEGRRIAQDIMAKLAIERDDLIEGSYSDLPAAAPGAA
jgi:predicted adenylyl cyclase CyaB